MSFVSPSDAIQLIVILLIAITFHELAHAVTATVLGDPTPRRNGQLSLNPFVHMETYGIVILFLSAFAGYAFAFGRTLIQPNNLKFGPQRGGAIVAIAGPLANVALAVAIGIGLLLNGTHVGFDFTGNLYCGPHPRAVHFLYEAMLVNVVLVVLNLIPIPPLDGFAIVSGFLTPRQLYSLAPVIQYGPILLLLALFIGLGSHIYTFAQSILDSFFPTLMKFC